MHDVLLRFGEACGMARLRYGASRSLNLRLCFSWRLYYAREHRTGLALSERTAAATIRIAALTNDASDSAADRRSTDRNAARVFRLPVRAELNDRRSKIQAMRHYDCTKNADDYIQYL
jgi:hypothetical protein